MSHHVSRGNTPREMDTTNKIERISRQNTPQQGRIRGKHRDMDIEEQQCWILPLSDCVAITIKTRHRSHIVLLTGSIEVCSELIHEGDIRVGAALDIQVNPMNGKEKLNPAFAPDNPNTLDPPIQDSTTEGSSG